MESLVDREIAHWDHEPGSAGVSPASRVAPLIHAGETPALPVRFIERGGTLFLKLEREKTVRTSRNKNPASRIRRLCHLGG
jgi:hypothetical protein